MEKTHKAIVQGLGHTDSSPASLAYKMLYESKYVNESLIQYMTNYITIMAKHPVIPPHLEGIKEICIHLNDTLEELGLIGISQYTR